jgi:hypothetical protein
VSYSRSLSGRALPKEAIWVSRLRKAELEPLSLLMIVKKSKT